MCVCFTACCVSAGPFSRVTTSLSVLCSAVPMLCDASLSVSTIAAGTVPLLVGVRFTLAAGLAVPWRNCACVC